MVLSDGEKPVSTVPNVYNSTTTPTPTPTHTLSPIVHHDTDSNSPVENSHSLSNESNSNSGYDSDYKKFTGENKNSSSSDKSNQKQNTTKRSLTGSTVTNPNPNPNHKPPPIFVRDKLYKDHNNNEIVKYKEQNKDGAYNFYNAREVYYPLPDSIHKVPIEDKKYSLLDANKFKEYNPEDKSKDNKNPVSTDTNSNTKINLSTNSNPDTDSNTNHIPGNPTIVDSAIKSRVNENEEYFHSRVSTIPNQLVLRNDNNMGRGRQPE